MISFVGAGPGAKDLITVRGMNLLKQADVIIYAGSLVSEDLLGYSKENCKIYNSAKMNLDEVVSVMKAADKNNLNVVRLHTGDPSIYGAIREQIDLLNNFNITYEIVPGVSSFCGAAAALKAEYTLPNVSQSVIITRMEGRTKVPDKERLSELAKHNATMVIFLSASMMDLVSNELIKGGYKEDTPAAIVYKATWPEEKIIRCTVGTLFECAKKNSITNHALITVGDFLGNDYELSKLYDSGFSTGYRASKSTEILKVSLISFSDIGEKSAKKIADLLQNNSSVEITDIYRCDSGKLTEWTAKHFREDDALIYVGACGIATRAIAPYINNKTVDPAVIVVDELLKNVIPLLSGHIGGANKLAEIIAEKLSANSCVTTATDINDIWAVDSWAVSKNMKIYNPENIKIVSSKLLKGETVYVDSCIEIDDLPNNVVVSQILDANTNVTLNQLDYKESDVTITYTNDAPSSKLTLIPKVLSVGIGCKKDTPLCNIEKLFDKTFSDNNLNINAVKGIYSIALKSDEKGMIEFAQKLGVKFSTFNEEDLNKLSGEYTSSDFVMNKTGVDCVCERSAVMGAGENSDSSLIIRKISENGVTVAVACQRYLHE